MEFEFTKISLILFATTAINLIATYIGWRRRNTKGGLYFAWGMTGITLWTLAAAFDYAAIPIDQKVIFAKIESIGYHSAVTLFALFALSYAGYDGRLTHRWARVLFLLIPLSNILLTLTNDWHGLIWNDFTPSPAGGNVVIFEHGPLFPWVIMSGYSMALLLIGALWLASRRGSEISRRQSRILFFASTFPVFTNLIYLFGVGDMEGVDWTSVTFSVSGLLFLLALYGTRFLDLVPIARHVIIERMSDCVLVLDTKNQLADFNPAAQKILGIEKSDLGSPIGIAMPPWAENDRLSRRSGQTAPLKGFSYHAHNKVFDVRVTHLKDHRNVLYGKLVILVDVTERDQTRLALEQHIQEIQDLHKELDSAQEQVMEKQRALARLEERRRLGRDMHDSVNQSIHSLMLSSETLEVLLEKGESEKAIEIAGRIRQSGMQALKEIRLLVFEARSIPTLENADLVTALQERLNMVERRVGINAEIVCQDDPSGKSPPEWKENIYWLTIEALNNSLKHGRASRVTIHIKSNGRMLDVKIEDNGTGFDPAHVQTGGIGMRTMRERAELINGSLNITSTPGQGTSVSVSTEIPHG